MQHYPELLEHFEVENDLELALCKLEHNPRMSIAISREHAYNNPSIPFSRIYCFEKSHIIYSYTLNFFVRKNFPYLDELDDFILITGATGLIEKWRTLDRIKPKVKYEERSIGVTSRTFFQVLFMFLTLCTLLPMMLLFERFVHKKAHKANASNIWILFEIFIDSDRHFMLESNCFWK